MNEPLQKKADEIIKKHGKETMFGGVKFNSRSSAIRALVEFAKYYEHYEHETPEEKIKEGNDVGKPVCIMCGKHYFTNCLCHI